MAVLEKIKKTKRASYALALLDESERNAVLRSVAAHLRDRVTEILEANTRDLEHADTANPLYDRLLLNEARILSMADDVEHVATLHAPIGKHLEHRARPNGLWITKTCVPLGVVAVIYESRPNVTIDVFTLCFKTGNACVLKGGKEAVHTNTVLVQILQDALKKHEIDPNVLTLLNDREDTHILLNAVGLVDVCIPRGGQSLINFVRNHAKIPVIETGAGIVHIYFDEEGDLTKGCDIIENAKTRRVSVCNSLDCLLLHKDRIHDLAALVAPLHRHRVKILADPMAYRALKAKGYPKELLNHAEPDDFGREFLCYKLAIRTVNSAKEAITYINAHTSHHSEGVITENEKVAEDFLTQIDAAVVYLNASTAFTDGGQFGMGAEIGISTQKLHARGPMGLDALTSYKWIVRGNGQIRPS